MIIQETRSSCVMGIFRSSITLGSAVITTVWSKAAMKAPKPAMVRMAQVECSRTWPDSSAPGLSAPSLGAGEEDKGHVTGGAIVTGWFTSSMISRRWESGTSVTTVCPVMTASRRMPVARSIHISSATG